MKYDPKFLNGSGIPTDRATINAWCRNFVALEPIVHETVEFYSTYPCKFLQIKPPQKRELNTFFKYQLEKVDLIDLIPQILKEYLIAGECFVYADLNEESKMWSRLFIQNPDYIIVKASITGDQPDISLRPDEKLRTLILKENPSEKELKELARMDKSIVEYVKRGENIPLSNFYVSHFCRKQSPYDVRGTSLLVPVLAKLAILQRVRKIGEEWNHILSDQRILEQEIKENLGHPNTLMKSDGYIRKDVARTRVLQAMQSTLIPWLEKKIFTPIAKINDFYEYKDGLKQLVIPKVTFDFKKFSAALDKDCAQTSAST